MAVKIYGNAQQSGCTQRMLLACHELGVEYDLHTVDMTKGEHKTTKFLTQLNPFGRLPVLVDGDVKLFESRAICRYLATKPTPAVLDVDRSDAIKVGLYEQMASVEYSYLHPAVSRLAYEMMFKKGDADKQIVEETLKEVDTTLDFMEKTLTDQQYLGCEDFTLLDVYTMPGVPFFQLLGLGYLIESRPALQDWWKRCSARDSWKHLMKLTGSAN